MSIISSVIWHDGRHASHRNAHHRNVHHIKEIAVTITLATIDEKVKRMHINNTTFLHAYKCRVILH